ncbi:MAG: hypothetical protein BVN35_17205 [Proteobacteria bacterium ST_bin11]|nr:MAG: hypothetical protein BVN35_17205 [Proteobacteria bacterium ST_bin11]
MNSISEEMKAPTTRITQLFMTLKQTNRPDIFSTQRCQRDQINHLTEKGVFLCFQRFRGQLGHAVQVLLCVFGPSLAAAATPDKPHFPIRQFVIQGNLKISSHTLESVVAPLTGDDRDFATIQAAVAAIQLAYKEAGYETIRVVIPKQEIDNGIVRLQVFEAVLGKVQLEGNKFFDDSNIRHALPSLKEGQTPDIRALGVNLRLVNESSAKQTQVTFLKGDDPQAVDAKVEVVDGSPWRAAASLDNTGTDATGDWRLGFAYMHSNLFNRDHVISAQYVTSPEHIENVNIFGLNYRIPLYTLGDALEFNASHSDVNSGVINTTAGSYGISGSGDNLGGHYIYLLPRVMGWDQRINVGFDFRRYQNNVTLQGGDGSSLVPDTQVNVLSASYIGFIRQPEREWAVNFGVYQNMPGGSKGDSLALEAARTGANASYTLMRYSVNFNQNLPENWQLRAEFSGQHTNDALISGEQFGLGGINSVRGFQERILANDKGHRASLELFTPDLAALLEKNSVKLRAVAFYNAANAWRNNPLPDEEDHNHISSIGLGLRGSVGQHAHLRLDLANILDTGDVSSEGQKLAQASVFCLF